MLSPVRRQMRRLPRRWPRITLVSSVQITRFQSYSVQCRWAKTKSSRAFFIAAVRPGLKVGFTFLKRSLRRARRRVRFETPRSLASDATVASLEALSWEIKASKVPTSKTY
jgi:hypothetical protein